MKKSFVLSALLIFFCLSAFSQDPEFEYYKSREIKKPARAVVSLGQAFWDINIYLLPAGLRR